MTKNLESPVYKDEAHPHTAGNDLNNKLQDDAYDRRDMRPNYPGPGLGNMDDLLNATKIARDVADDGQFDKGTRDILLKSLADGSLAKEIELANKQLAAQGSDKRISEHEFTEKMKYQTADEHRPGVTTGIIKDNPRADIQVMDVDTGEIVNQATLKVDEAMKGYRKPEPVFPTPMEITPLSK